ncbi:MAG: mechanosensitive ion channel [Proteobacteria bacterium]|nr:mechanosensitive ion channel [Pseudomonadota bacterium]
MSQRPPAARAALVVFAGALLAPAVARAQDAPDLGTLANIVRWGGVALSVLVIAASMIALRIVGDLAARLSKRFANRRPLIQKVESTTRFVVYLVAAGICLGLSVRLDKTAMTVIGGALAFAVGFAMRDLVAAFIAGITIMFDRPFQVGDRVTYAGQYGDIIKIGLRSVRMNTLDHNIITIPNNKVLTDVTSSGNYGALEMQVAMDFYIGADQDAKLAAELVREACLTSPYIFLDQEVPVLAKQTILEDYVAVHLKARPYVFDCKYEKPFETDVHFRVLDAFRANEILPPAVLHRHVGEEGKRALSVPGPQPQRGAPAA